jgi:hypothetical protein
MQDSAGIALAFLVLVCRHPDANGVLLVFQFFL